MTERESKYVDFLKSEINSQLSMYKSFKKIEVENTLFIPSNILYEFDRVLNAIRSGKSYLKLRLNDKNGNKNKFKLDIDSILNSLEDSEINKETLTNTFSLKPDDPKLWESCYSHQVNERKKNVEIFTDILLLFLFYILPCMFLASLLTDTLVQKVGVTFKKGAISGILKLFFTYIIARGFYSFSHLRKFGKKICKIVHFRTRKLVEIIM